MLFSKDAELLDNGFVTSLDQRTPQKDLPQIVTIGTGDDCLERLPLLKPTKVTSRLTSVSRAL